MARLTKKQKEAQAKIEKNKLYSLDEASSLIKEITNVKFDASIDLAVRLGVDPRKANQMVRGVVTLPHGTGKDVKVLALVTPDKEAEAKEAGADHVGLDEYIQKIQGGWTDVDVVIAAPNVMAQLGRVGRILGPRGLMPNPKTGTVTPNVGAAVKDVKGGKISFRVDKFGIQQTLMEWCIFLRELSIWGLLIKMYLLLMFLNQKQFLLELSIWMKQKLQIMSIVSLLLGLEIQF